jgi:hypothetical protein
MKNLSNLFNVLDDDPDFKLTTCVTGFKETANPYYVWQAIRVCTEHNKAFPEWVIRTYLKIV